MAERLPPVTWVHMSGESAICYRCGVIESLSDVEQTAPAIAHAFIVIRDKHARCTGGR